MTFLKVISQESPDKSHWDKRLELPLRLSRSKDLTDMCNVLRL